MRPSLGELGPGEAQRCDLTFETIDIVGGSEREYVAGLEAAIDATGPGTRHSRLSPGVPTPGLAVWRDLIRLRSDYATSWVDCAVERTRFRMVIRSSRAGAPRRTQCLRLTHDQFDRDSLQLLWLSSFSARRRISSVRLCDLMLSMSTSRSNHTSG